MKRSSNPLTFQDRDNYLKDQKQVIALKALSLLKEGMTIFMDGGTTVCTLVACIPANLKLRIITSNMMIVPLLQDKKKIELIVLGGNYCPETASTVGEVACSEIENYAADLYMMGVCAVDPTFGVTAEVQQDAAVKRAMLKSSRKVIALVNHASLHIEKPFKVCDLDRLDTFVTDLASTANTLDAFRHKIKELL